MVFVVVLPVDGNQTSGINSPVEGQVVFLPLFIGFQHHPRWLFGISAIYSSTSPCLFVKKVERLVKNKKNIKFTAILCFFLLHLDQRSCAPHPYRSTKIDHPLPRVFGAILLAADHQKIIDDRRRFKRLRKRGQWSIGVLFLSVACEIPRKLYMFGWYRKTYAITMIYSVLVGGFNKN